MSSTQLNRTAQWFAYFQQVRLPGELIEAPWTHAIGERSFDCLCFLL